MKDVADQDRQHRTRLPETRESVTHRFTVGGMRGYLTVGLSTVGEPMEIFIRVGKVGSIVRGMFDCWCRAVSIGLQYGAPLRVIVDGFKDHAFPPMGETSNPDIKEARSIVDYVVRFLDLHWGKKP